MTQLFYPNAAGSHTIEGEYVTITQLGDMAISATLLKSLPEGHFYMRITLNIDDETQRKTLFLTPSSVRAEHCLSLLLPSGGNVKRRGQQGRIGARSGFRQWGIVPEETTRYTAEWIEGSLVVDLSRVWHAGGTPPVKPVVVPLDDNTGMVPNKEHPLADGLVGYRLMNEGPAVRGSKQKPRKCQTCFYWRKGKCDNSANRPKYGLSVGAGEGCDLHVRGPVTTIRSGNLPAGDPPQPDSEVRVPAAEPTHTLAFLGYSKQTCPRCGHKVFVNARGKFWSHDIYGNTYRGDVYHKADRTRRCPGQAL